MGANSNIIIIARLKLEDKINMFEVGKIFLSLKVSR